ncbi:MAG: DUF3090 family protein [Anaerolineae bacterium]|nr:DUF3090 family protein [Anaerolineae bacterium]
MSTEIELNPVDFITAGTVGPKGRRVFYLQAGHSSKTVSLILEKEQARALGDAIKELLDDLNERYPDNPEKHSNIASLNMELRDPIEPEFRIAQIGLGYDEVRNQVVIVVQEMVVLEEDEDPELMNPGVARFWGSREQFRALSQWIAKLVDKGRANPKTNGRVIYYWT